MRYKPPWRDRQGARPRGGVCAEPPGGRARPAPRLADLNGAASEGPSALSEPHPRLNSVARIRTFPRTVSAIRPAWNLVAVSRRSVTQRRGRQSQGRGEERGLGVRRAAPAPGCPAATKDRRLAPSCGRRCLARFGALRPVAGGV